MLKQAGILCVTLAVLATLAPAQDQRFDFSLNATTLFTNTSSGFGITQTATEGGGGFGTIRARVSPKHSFAFTYGRDKNSQIYRTFDDFHVVTSISEYSFNYMFTPFTKGRFEPFLLAGVGAFRFSPQSTWVIFPPLSIGVPDNIQVNLHAAKQTQIGYMYGFGVDYRLPRFERFALRLQYRGIFYKDPDFHVDANAGSAVSFFTGARAHLAEPSIGLVFRF